VSRLRKTPQPFRWTTIPVAFTQGTVDSVNLANYLSNPQARTITYSVVGSLPSGVTLAGSTVSYNGTGVAATASVRFRATSGSYEADSNVTTVSIAAVASNSDPVWLTPTNLGTIQPSTPFSFTLTAVDVDSDPINFIVGALPGNAQPTELTQTGTSRAIVIAGSGLSAGTYTFTINADDEPPLGQVFGLVASTLSTTSIGLVWTAVSNATSYQVERSFTGTGTWTVLGTVATASYTSTGLDPGTLYFYRVRALSATQTGEYSAAASATTVALGDAETDWTIRSTLPGTVFAHDFRTQSEIDAFVSNPETVDAARTRWNPPGTGIPGTGGGAINSACFGTTVQQEVTSVPVGTVETWLIADAGGLPDPADGGSYIAMLGSNAAGEPMEGVRVTAKNDNDSTITVTRGQQLHPSNGVTKAYPIGQKIGSDPTNNWKRPLGAVLAPGNGKTVNDIGITQGHSLPRTFSSTPSNPNELDRNLGFGWWGAEMPNYPTWTDDRGSVWTDMWEGTEFYLQFRVRWTSGRFQNGATGKALYIDGGAVGSGIHQIFGNILAKGEGVPATFNFVRSHGDSNATAGPNFSLDNSELPGGDYPLCLTNDFQNINTCFTVTPNQWITFLIHLIPGGANYIPRRITSIANDLQMLSSASQPTEELLLTGAAVDQNTGAPAPLPDPATWGEYPLQVRGQATAASGGGTRTEIMKVLAKNSETSLTVMRNWYRSSGSNYVLPAGTRADYGMDNNVNPITHAASWINDPHMCPNHNSYMNVYAAYEGETTYRTVMQSPALPFIYGRGTTNGQYGDGKDQLPGFRFFKPESYMNAYVLGGTGSQGPPPRFDALYTQIILSRNFIPCPQ
jgi:hypothetical protein